MKQNIARLILISTVLLSILLHFKVFTTPVQAWRESRTAWNIRLFIREDANILNPRIPYLNNGETIERYEFPFMQWTAAMLQKITGEHILVMRIFAFIISLITLFTIYKIALLLTSDALVGAITVWIFTFLPTFFYHSTSVMPDLSALCFAMLYLLFFLRFLKSRNDKDLLYAAIFISLAGLIKLPYILIGSFAILEFFNLITIKKPEIKKKIFQYILINLAALVPVIAWYAIVVPGWKGNNIAAGFMTSFVGWPLFLEFFRLQMLENIPTRVFNLPTLAFLFIGVYYLVKERSLFFLKPSFFLIPFLILFAYFLYVLNVIREGHDYYLMPFYAVVILPLILGINRSLEWRKPWLFFVWLTILIMPVICWRKVKDDWNIDKAYLNKDFFECRDQLEKIGNRDDIVIVVNDHSIMTFLYILDNKGYVFWNDHLPVEWIKDIIRRENAPYLFSDSRHIESQTGFYDCIQSKILECGSLNVFRLKTADELPL